MSTIRINYFIGDRDFNSDKDYDITGSNKRNTTLPPIKLKRKPKSEHKQLHFSSLLILIFIEPLSIG